MPLISKIRMKRAFLSTLLLCGVALTAQTTAKDTGADTLRIAVEGAFPPFSEVSAKGQMVGFDIDIAEALCAELNRQCELVQVEWDGLIPALNSRKVDAVVASMTITDERKQRVNFTDKYYQNPNKFVRRKGSDIEVTKTGMTGKVIGVQNATVFERYISDTYGDVVEIKRYSTQDEANADLLAGRVDAVLADAIGLEEGFLKTAQGQDFEFFGPDLTESKYFGYGAGIAINKDNDILTEQFNSAIKTIRSNGKYKEINDKYFEFDIYSGQNDKSK